MYLKGRPLVRLRVAFVIAGSSLLLAVGGLLYAVLDRIEEQRALRHRMVAERIFDEVEREISSLLEHESRRPSSAYDATSTRVERWSPFVVGYFRLDPELRIVAGHQLPAERRGRLRRAVDAAERWPATSARGAAPGDPPEGKGAPPETAEPLGAPGHPSSLDVLLKLNRGAKVRQRQQRRHPSAFHVQAVGPGTLVMQRVSPGGERREGFIVDVPALVDFIQSWLIARQGLGDVAKLHVAGTAPDEGVRYRFEHRLAAPLDSQRVALSMGALDDDDATGFLVSLAALLAVAALLGLFALYRMVAVQVQFAERRQNFVSAVTHELKTPLTAIRMYGEMLADDMTSDETTRHEYYEIIKAEAERLTRLIENVMEHARIRKGERAVHPIVGDLGATVRHILEVMDPHIARQQFVVNVEMDDQLPRARFDPDALKQVLFNVVDNALKYGRRDAHGEGSNGADGEGNVLGVRCGADGAGGVYVAVHDRGPGIEERQLGRIFQPFFRGGSELTRRQPGTGIGLALVRDLVGRMEGQVRARNCKPGLEVRITLREA